MRFFRVAVRLLLLLLVIGLPATAEKVSAMPAPTGYVNDYAGVLSVTAKAQMESLARELRTKTKAQLFVVTINTLDGEPVETFANELFRKWKIGEKKTDRGVLLLLSIRDHKRRIEVGYGLEGVLNDAKTGDIGRDMVPDLKALHYDAAVDKGERALARVIADESNVTLDGLSGGDEGGGSSLADVPSTPAPSQLTMPRSAKIVLIVMVVFFFGVFGLIAFFVIRATRNGVRSGVGSGVDDSGSSYSSSDSGSSSSSSSSSSSDSGSSFSGGDGGDSGGGGSSGDW